MDLGMAPKPGALRRMRVGGVDVDHHMQPRTGLRASDLTKNSRELLMTVPLMAGVRRVAGEHPVSG